MVRLAQVATARQAQLQDGRRLGFAQYGEPEGIPVIMFHDVWAIAARAIRMTQFWSASASA